VRFELNGMGVRGLTVTSANSEITLKGDVETGRELARIAKAVQAVPGVRAVIPDINVKR
jgi:osmotically-inducible protein OsmY